MIRALRHPSVLSWLLAAGLIWYVSHLPDSQSLANRMTTIGVIFFCCLPSFIVTSVPRRFRQAPFVSPHILGWLTVVVLLFAATVRVWKIWEWPPHGSGFEEFQIASRANVGTSPVQNFLALYTNPGEHTLTAYAISVSFAFLGTGFVEMRLPCVIVSMLCPTLLYAVCRKLVSWEVSLFAVALFAVSWWQIAAGRVADEIFFPMWAEIAVLWLMLHFEDTGRMWAAFLLAFLSGLLVYEYTSYHLVVMVVIGYLVARIALFILYICGSNSAWRQIFVALRTYGPGLIVMILVWDIIAHFQLLRDITNGMGSWFVGGVGEHARDADGLLVHLSSPGTLPDFFLRKLAIPLHAAYVPGYSEVEGGTNIGARAAFDLATASVMAVGFVLVVATFWRRFHAFVLAWALLIICGAALFPANANLHRYYVGLPLYYLIIALGAEVLWQGVRVPMARYILLGVFVAVVGYAAVDNIRHVFWELFPDQTLRANWIWPRTAIIDWIRAHKRSDWICVVTNDERAIYGPNPMQPEWKFLVQGWNVQAAESVSGCLSTTEDSCAAQYYILALPDSPVDLEAQLRSLYPWARELDSIKVEKREFIGRTFVVDPRGCGGDAQEHQGNC